MFFFSVPSAAALDYFCVCGFLDLRSGSEICDDDPSLRPRGRRGDRYERTRGGGVRQAGRAENNRFATK